jgi:nitrite reductase/ring-hydroxylating ferredoxin subunit
MATRRKTVEVAESRSATLPDRRPSLIPPKWVAIDRVRLVLANVDGQFYAIRDVCGHKNAPLSRGRLDGCMIECPLHFAIFDVRTGRFVDGPISADVPVYEVRIEGDVIYVKR